MSPISPPSSSSCFVETGDTTRAGCSIGHIFGGSAQSRHALCSTKPVWRWRRGVDECGSTLVLSTSTASAPMFRAYPHSLSSSFIAWPRSEADQAHFASARSVLTVIAW